MVWSPLCDIQQLKELRQRKNLSKERNFVEGEYWHFYRACIVTCSRSHLILQTTYELCTGTFPLQRSGNNGSSKVREICPQIMRVRVRANCGNLASQAVSPGRKVTLPDRRKDGLTHTQSPSSPQGQPHRLAAGPGPLSWGPPWASPTSRPAGTYVLGRERGDAADEAAQARREGRPGGRGPATPLVLQEESWQRRQRLLHYVAHRRHQRPRFGRRPASRPAAAPPPARLPYALPVCLKKKSLFVSGVDKHSVVLDRGRKRARESMWWERLLKQLARESDLRRNRRTDWTGPGPVSVAPLSGASLSQSSWGSQSDLSHLHFVLQGFPWRLAASALPVEKCRLLAPIRPRCLRDHKQSAASPPSATPRRARAMRAPALRATQVHAVLATWCRVTSAALQVHRAGFKAGRVEATRNHCRFSSTPFSWDLGNSQDGKWSAKPCPPPTPTRRGAVQRSPPLERTTWPRRRERMGVPVLPCPAAVLSRCRAHHGATR